MGGGIEGLIGMLAGGQGGAQGLGALVERLRQAGLGEQVDSWVGTGANRPVAPEQLAQAFGPEALQGLAQRLGVGGGGGVAGGGVAAALAALLPQVINGLTPQGRVPQSDVEFGQGGMAGALAQMMGAMAGGQGAAPGGGGLAGMLGGLLGAAQGPAAAGGQGGGGLSALLGGLLGGGAGLTEGKPGLGGDGGGPLPQKPRPLG
jgi:uncharacterized protein YidB (DUF937 family)